MNPETETFEPLSALTDVRSLIEDYIYVTFHIDRNDNIWLANGNGGMTRVNLLTGKILMGVGRGRVVFAITRECIISPLSLRLRARHIFIPLKILKKVPGSARNSLPLIMIILFSLMRTGIST